jgi:hypothetical protein
MKRIVIIGTGLAAPSAARRDESRSRYAVGNSKFDASPSVTQLKQLLK